MKVPKATARLAAVVQVCGKPEAVTLWATPRNNPPFKAAIQANRVMTIKQEIVGTRKDFGVVGFHPEANVNYWVFPKSLSAFEGKRIVGIDYSVLQAPRIERGDTPAKAVAKQKKPTSRGSAAASALPQTERPTAPPPKPRPVPRFRVIVRCVSFLELPVVVEAGSKKEAKEKAVASLAGHKIDFSTGTQSRSAVRADQMKEGERESLVNVLRRLRGRGQRGE